MIRTIPKTVVVLGFALSILFPAVSFAVSATDVYDGGIGSADPADTNTFQLVSCTGVKDPRITDPAKAGVECDYAQLIYTINRIIRFVLYIISPILLIMLGYTGFKYVTAGGDANLVADAKRMLKPVVVGVILILGAWTFVYTILDKLLNEQISQNIKKTDIIKK